MQLAVGRNSRHRGSCLRQLGQLTTLILLLLLQAKKTCSVSDVSGNETDRAALLAFKHAVSGGPAGPLSSWNDSLPFCRWRGVSCLPRHAHAGRVTTLSLASLGLTGSIPAVLGNLTFLSSLELSGNALTGAIPPSIGGMRRLRWLDLSGNQLGGAIPPEAVAPLTNLTHLNLSRNQLVGDIPPELGRLAALVDLDLSRNHFTGSIPPSVAALSSLQSINLGANNLTGTIPPSLFANLTALVGFGVNSNNLHGSLPEEIGLSRSLQYIVASLNNLDGELPASMYNVTSIRMIELSYNSFTGSLRPDIGDRLPDLYFLSMFGNELAGGVPASLANASAMQTINLGENYLVGLVPVNLGGLRDLLSLSLSFNNLQAATPSEWQFLDDLTNCSKLKTLHMFHNDLSGELPSSVANLSTELVWLSLSYNRISGTIPSGIGNLARLATFRLQANNFFGPIPESVGLLANMVDFLVFGNRLTGTIPLSLGNLTKLTELELSENKLVGEVPPSLAGCRSLGYLSVGGNRLTGTIPPRIFTITAMSYILNMSNNFLSGDLPVEVGHLQNLQTLDLANNRLTGAIPVTIGQCQILQRLDLHGNLFTGSVSLSSFGSLKGLEELDMSGNNLSGEFPGFLQDLQYLRLLNLSFNRLVGEVPVKGVFANATAVQVAGNGDLLCGGIPELRLRPCATDTTLPATDRLLAVKLAVPLACIAVVLVISVSLVLTRRRGKRAWPKVANRLEELHRKVSYAELSNATDGFSSGNLIGAGSHGSVYRGTMLQEDGTELAVAVKVFGLRQQQGAPATFAAECEALRHARHRNLARILMVCASLDSKGEEFKALVYGYMPNGSLERWLHPEPSDSGGTLTLVQRLNAAADVASALDYLHNDCQVPIAHCDLKPSNVLLDDDMVARVGDFGLARFLDSTEPCARQASSLVLMGSIGYIAPEYRMGGQACASGDVYSYGILLLEMLTGKRPTDAMFRDGLTLAGFVGEAADSGGDDGVLSVVDPRLLVLGAGRNRGHRPLVQGASAEERCLFSVATIGVSCASELQMERPGMKQVANEMAKLRASLLDSVLLKTSAGEVECYGTESLG
ncbi:probable LRR receptor-like serine/threonine-protein kinase At3g47570 [Brachypodium distachyon]|uniref:Receptor kinase-like protein Xa21 n=1 Tax=Brachypodium distachyon TaxID=15368 RepID=A0A0Q3FWT4_BRADI|nr:probable LRR receptor-like serine/threonine-protein kinase At3g47570 [Brachypodium distachyon]KQK03912.1 hypothetical protein BRADI_2g10623v3 [Brachypodium distachyon]|eukprot:XP_003565662.1 probable LRR receptor-like serine/threonine-protein kinase At3g47570 [Brachypodium distachyon]